MSRIIILTQYYPPETGAPQNRLHSFARYLIATGNDVQVVTAMANYPRNQIFPQYRRKFKTSESIDGVSVLRSWIFVSSSRNVVARLLNYFSFVITSFLVLVRVPRGDYLICESPPLFLGITAVLISKLKGMRLIFNVSDLWPESAEKLGIVTNRLLIRISYMLEAWIYRRAFLVSGQTRGIVRSIDKRFPTKLTFWLPNGVDFDFLASPSEDRNWRKDLCLRDDDFVVLYAGILGHAQGLEVVLKAASLLKDRNIHFVIVGDGPEKQKLEELKGSLGLSNVHMVPSLEKKRIPGIILQCDAYVVPLKKLDLFKGAIPSKIFEPLALKKPILLGVEGEAKDLFIDEGRGGLFFEPENAVELANQCRRLQCDPQLSKNLAQQGYLYVRQHFDRFKIHDRFMTFLKENENQSRNLR